MASGKSTYEPLDASDLQLYKAIIDEQAEFRISSLKQYEKIFKAVIDQLGDQELRNARAVYDEKIDQEKKFIAKCAENGRKMTSDEINNLTEYQRERKHAEEVYYKSRQRFELQASNIAQKAEQNRYDKLTAYQQAMYQKVLKQRFKEEKDELKTQQQLLEATIEGYSAKLSTATGEQQAQLSLAIDEAKKELSYNLQLQVSADTGKNTADKELQTLLKESKLFDATTSSKTKGEFYREAAKDKENDKLEILAEAAKKIAEVKEAPEMTDKERAAEIRAIQNAANKQARDANNDALVYEVKAAIHENKAAQQQKNKEAWSPDGLIKSLQSTLNKFADNLGSRINSGLNEITDNVNTFYEYQAKVEARLQGTEVSYADSLEKIRNNVNFSGYIRQKDVITNLVKLVDTGVSYNVDLRAFLATISDDIAATFDAFDSDLLKLIRIQQADTTAARLGMEASLTKLFNEYFSDTSYLSDAYDGVSKVLSEVSALKNKDDSLEFEYMVQKWLGSLYSVGLSDSAANKIAEGISYLGTGNVDALNSNESLQTLLAMSASHAGLSYADLLTGDLTSENTNRLLKGMIEYLQEIANNTDSSVVTKSAYANLFGLSTTDLRSIQNISNDSIDKLYEENLTYNNALTELQYQTSQIASRTHISQVLANVLDNAMMSTATTLANQTDIWSTWMVLDVIEKLTGGIDIPTVTVMGNSVDLNTTVTALAKSGIAGQGLMSSLLEALSSGEWGANFNLNAWGFDEYTARGQELQYQGIQKTPQTGISVSKEFITNSGLASMGDEYNEYNEFNDYSSEQQYVDASSVYNNTYQNNNQKYYNDTGYVGSSINEEYNNNYSNNTHRNNQVSNGFGNASPDNRYSGSVSVDDIRANSLASGAAAAHEDSTITNSEVNESGDIYQKIYNAIADDSNSVISRINELHNNVVVNGNALKVNVDFNNLGTMPVQIDNMSDVMKKYLDERIRSVISTTFGDGSVKDEDGTYSVVTALKAALDNINVTVTNDFFDAYYQKQAFTV